MLWQGTKEWVVEYHFLAFMKSLRQLLLLLLVMASGFKHVISSTISTTQFNLDNGLCLSWRLAVEANNMEPWPTVPTACLIYVKSYMLRGQYNKDVEMVVDQIYEFLSSIVVKDDDKDAWILDVDDTCISNIIYYQGKRFGWCIGSLWHFVEHLFIFRILFTFLFWVVSGVILMILKGLRAGQWKELVLQFLKYLEFIRLW